MGKFSLLNKGNSRNYSSDFKTKESMSRSAALNSSMLKIKEIEDEKNFTLCSGSIDLGKMFFQQNVNNSVNELLKNDCYADYKSKHNGLKSNSLFCSEDCYGANYAHQIMSDKILHTHHLSTFTEAVTQPTNSLRKRKCRRTFKSAEIGKLIKNMNINLKKQSKLRQSLNSGIYDDVFVNDLGNLVQQSSSLSIDKTLIDEE